MFIDGVETTKKDFLGRYDYKKKGVLSIVDTTNQGSHKTIKIAYFQSTILDVPPYELYDPKLIWMNDERFVISGYERKLVDGNIVRFAQSWLCRNGWDDLPIAK